jgi:hypothetical protein
MLALSLKGVSPDDRLNSVLLALLSSAFLAPKPALGILEARHTYRSGGSRQVPSIYSSHSPLTTRHYPL